MDTPRLEAAMRAAREDLSHPFHSAPRRVATLVLRAADEVMFSDEAVERMAEAMWLHRPLERLGMGEPKPFADLKPYQIERYKEWARAAMAALKDDR